MIIEDCSQINNHSPEAAWASLQRFQNVPHVAERIVALHRLQSNQVSNARKQARQLRYCLMQAREYYIASAAVTLATRPTLAYYSIMSLALCEILFKQTGNSSLDRAREQHRHHGLVFEHNQSSNADQSRLGETAKQLRARPLIKRDTSQVKDVRAGTFELWHQTAREMPLVGKRGEAGERGVKLERTACVASAGDVRLPPVPSAGLSLLECLQNIPGMTDHLQQAKVPHNFARGKVSLDIASNQTAIFTIVVHPSEQADAFIENILIHPSLHPRVDLQKLSSGGIIKLSTRPEDQQHDEFLSNSFAIPPACAWDEGETRFWATNQPLTEFGFLYVALFIVGNYARYYPDRWLLDVENSTALALAVEELLRVAATRMPWLTLSELERTYYVPRE